MRSVGPATAPRDLARVFSHTLIPIAMAYVVAHYFSLLVYQGQALGYLVSDPLGHGSDLFGTARATIDYGVIGANGDLVRPGRGADPRPRRPASRSPTTARWSMYDDPRNAIRSQYWMLAVMVGFTSLGLWILSAAAQ